MTPVVRVLAWVLAANLAVVVAKLIVGLRSGSIAVLGDAGHSGVDSLNNVVALLAIRMAVEPADEEHPYGHGKFEMLGALAVVSFLSITCFELASHAVRRLLQDAPPPRAGALAFYVLGATMLVNIAVAWAEGRAARRWSSALLGADARHTSADVLVTLSVLGGLVLVRLGWGAADAWLGIVVALLIAWSGWQILRTTVPVLVDTRAVAPERIRRLALGAAGVLEATDIRSRGQPGEAFAELTILIDPDNDVEAAHRIADRVEKRLEREAGFAGVVVHVEPVRARSAGVDGRETPRGGGAAPRDEGGGASPNTTSGQAAS